MTAPEAQVANELKHALVMHLQGAPWFRGAGVSRGPRGRLVVTLLASEAGRREAARVVTRMGLDSYVQVRVLPGVRLQGLDGLASSICSGEPAVRAATEQVRADARELMKTSKWVTVAVAAAAGAVGSIARGPVVGGVLAGGLAWLMFTTQAATYNFD